MNDRTFKSLVWAWVVGVLLVTLLVGCAASTYNVEKDYVQTEQTRYLDHQEYTLVLV